MLHDLPLSLLHPIAALEPVPFLESTHSLELSSLMSEAREAIIHVDEDWVVRYCNDVYLDDIRLTREQVIGRTPFDYQPSFKRSIFYETIETCRLERRPMAAIGYSTVLGRWLMVRVFPAGSGMVMLANDASETVVRQYQLAQQALKDTLTGLRNKLAMVQDMQARLARNEPFTLAVLGLNRFTTVNDAQGYACGDAR